MTQLEKYSPYHVKTYIFKKLFLYNDSKNGIIFVMG